MAIQHFQAKLKACKSAIGGAVSRLYQVLGSQSIAQQFKAACSEALQLYTDQSAVLSQQNQPQLQQRLATNMAEKDKEGITEQFSKDVKRKSVSFSIGKGAAAFIAAQDDDLYRAMTMIKATFADDPKWVDLTQSICAQTSANETGLNALISTLSVVSGMEAFSDSDAANIHYSFDFDVPKNTVIPEKDQDGSIRALNVSCHSVSSAVKKDTSELPAKIIERLPFSLDFNSSYRVTLDAKGQPVVSGLTFSVKIIDTPPLSIKG